MAPPPELIDDAVAEILLRLPPDDPACLVRASLVCKPWRRILSDRAFPRRYREFHRTPPLRGFLHSFYESEAGDTDRFVPITARIPLLRPAFRCQALDCRHGRVLLDVVGGSRGTLAVLDPLDHKVWQEPDDFSYSHYCYSGVVLCAAAGCDPHDCHGGPFLVVFVGNTDTVARAWVYLSEAATWSAPAAVRIADHDFIERKRGAIVGDEIQFILSMGSAILKFDLGKHCLSVIGSPCAHSMAVVLVSMQDGSLGLAGVKGSTRKLHLWSRKVNPEGVARWVQYRVIVLEKLLPIDKPYHRANVIGFAEGVGVLLVGIDVSTFMFELKSGRAKKVSKPGY